MADGVFWEVGELDFDHQIRLLVDENVRAAYDDVFKTGRLWIDHQDGMVAFEFTDKNFEFRQAFSVAEIAFCGVEDDKQAVIAALEALIQRVKDL